MIFAGSANSSILAACSLFKDFGGEKSWFYDNYVTNQLICLPVTSFYAMKQQCGLRSQRHFLLFSINVFYDAFQMRKELFSVDVHYPFILFEPFKPVKKDFVSIICTVYWMFIEFLAQTRRVITVYFSVNYSAGPWRMSFHCLHRPIQFYRSLEIHVMSHEDQVTQLDSWSWLLMSWSESGFP